MTPGVAVSRPLVVIPTYNEASNIGEMVRRVAAIVPTATVLVVDDGSPDGTADVVTSVGAETGGDRVHVLRRAGKLGLGTAYRAGFRWGLERGHDALVQMDADFQHDPKSVPALLAALDRGADMVIGSRYVPGGSIPDSWPWRRKQLSRWGNRYVSAVLGLDVRDATAGFRAHRSDAIARLDLDAIRADGYGFQIELTYRTRQAGGTIDEVPIQFGERVSGESKMSGRIIAEAFRMVTVWGVVDRLSRRSR
ncbi:MAG: dolichol-phosphate mannosyltransferase [Acidimicrobiaceae bacterium]